MRKIKREFAQRQNNMLEQLFGSKTRTKLLKIFLLNTEKAFFIRELTRMIDTQINSVRRELDNLVHCGVVRVVSEKDTVPGLDGVGTIVDEEQGTVEGKAKRTTKDKTPKKFFAVNKNFVLHKELRVLFSRSPLLFQERFIKEIRALESLDYALMTGFFVEAQDAPVDLLIVGSVPKQKLNKVIAVFEKEFEREINFTTMTSEEFLYRKSLTDRFLSRILEGKKIVIIDNLTSVSAR